LGRPEYRIKYFKPFAACALSMKERAIEDVAIFVLRLRLLQACRGRKNLPRSWFPIRVSPQSAETVPLGMLKFDQIEMVTGCWNSRGKAAPLGAGAMCPQRFIKGRKTAAYWQIGNCFGLGIVPMRL
jgi:hypothetical protein